MAENIRSLEKSLNIPDLISEGSISYGMQTFDQSLMQWYKKGVISYRITSYNVCYTKLLRFGTRRM